MGGQLVASFHPLELRAKSQELGVSALFLERKLKCRRVNNSTKDTQRVSDLFDFSPKFVPAFARLSPRV